MVILSEFLTKQMSFTCKNKYFLRSLNEIQYTHTHKKRAINTVFSRWYITNIYHFSKDKIQAVTLKKSFILLFENFFNLNFYQSPLWAH